MKVSQNFVSIRHFVYDDNTDRIYIAKNYVVYDHQLRSHMLREFMRYLHLVSEEDRWTVLQLATDYLGQSGPLRSHCSWSKAVEGQRSQVTIGTSEWNALNHLEGLLALRQPY